MKKEMKAIVITVLVILFFSAGVFIGTLRKGINISVNADLDVQNSAKVEAPVTNVNTTAVTAPATIATASTVTETAATVSADATTATPSTVAPVTQVSETQASSTEAAPEASEYSADENGVVFKVEGENKIWANRVGQAYMLFKDIDAPNEWGESGKVYELYVAQFGNNYSMWSDGQWNLDSQTGTLELTPVNQSENGNVGAAEGETKTITAVNGEYVINVSFSSGGKTTMILKP